MVRTALAVRVSAGLVSMAAATASAQETFDWISRSSGDFLDPANWSPRGGPPAAPDTARFGIDTPKVPGIIVSFGADVTNASLVYDASALHFDLGGNTYLVSGDFPCAEFGGEITLADGTLDTLWSVVTGSMAFVDASATWLNTNGLYVNGVGDLAVLDGAHAHTGWLDIAAAPGGNASVLASGEGTSLDSASALAAGSVGVGALTVSDHADVTASYAAIGDQASSDGSVRVESYGTWTIAGDLAVGSAGSGALEVVSVHFDESASVAVGGVLLVGFHPTGHGTVTVDGPGSTLAVSGYGAIGVAGDADVTVTMGASMHTPGAFILGDGAGSTGDILLDGQYAVPLPPALGADGYIVVGSEGAGSIEAIVQGTVSTGVMILGELPGSAGSLELTFGPMLDVDGYLDVGRGGHGALVLDTFSTAMAGSAALGTEATGTGDVTVADATLTLTDGALSVGVTGDGEFEATDGAQVSVNGGPDSLGGLVVIATAPGSSGSMTVSGADTLVESTSQLVVASGGVGTLDLSGAAEIRAQANESPSGSACIIGLAPGSQGAAQVSGAARLTCLGGSLNVGFNDGSHGTLTIDAGGEATSAGGFVGRFEGSAGAVHVTGLGSSWTSGADIDVGVAGTGALRVTDQASVAAPTVRVGANGRVEGTGTLVGIVENGGVVEPGALNDSDGDSEVGTLTVDGTYVQSAEGRLVIDLAGIGPGEHDLLLIQGTQISLAGTIELRLAEGFRPRAGDGVIVVAGGLILGVFDAVESPVPVTVTEYETIVLVTFDEGCAPADLNCDGTVDAADLAILLGAWSTADPAADLDDSGNVDAADLAILLGSWS